LVVTGQINDDDDDDDDNNNNNNNTKLNGKGKMRRSCSHALTDFDYMHCPSFNMNRFWRCRNKKTKTKMCFDTF
jgi:hypothetical protein